MAKTFRPYVPEQDYLLPPSLREWLPADHLAYFVSDLVDQLDVAAITEPYEQEERGFPPYHPVMLTKVLLYAYCVGVFSSRKLQRRLTEDVAFRVLAAGNEPDFRTIADFRRRHLAALQGLFVHSRIRFASRIRASRVSRRRRSSGRSSPRRSRPCSASSCASVASACVSQWWTSCASCRSFSTMRR
jgi:transposase